MDVLKCCGKNKFRFETKGWRQNRRIHAKRTERVPKWQWKKWDQSETNAAQIQRMFWAWLVSSNELNRTKLYSTLSDTLHISLVDKANDSLCDTYGVRLTTAIYRYYVNEKKKNSTFIQQQCLWNLWTNHTKRCGLQYEPFRMLHIEIQ